MVCSVLKPPGVEPYWTGETAKEDAIGYAKARLKLGRSEIRVLKQDGSIEEIIPLGDPKRPSFESCKRRHVFRLVNLKPSPI